VIEAGRPRVSGHNLSYTVRSYFKKRKKEKGAEGGRKGGREGKKDKKMF
jgi:hypothetical protein